MKGTIALLYPAGPSTKGTLHRGRSIAHQLAKDLRENFGGH